MQELAVPSLSLQYLAHVGKCATVVPVRIVASLVLSNMAVVKVQLRFVC